MLVVPTQAPAHACDLVSNERTTVMNTRPLCRFLVLGCALSLFASLVPTRARVEAPAAPASPRSRLTANDDRVAELLSQMTLAEKVGQMTQAEHRALASVADIERYFLGSLLSGGGSGPVAGNSAQAWADMCDAYQRQALRTRLKIPLIYGVDAVHGHNNVSGAVVFPHNIGLGCAGDPELVERAARVTAVEVRATGANLTFAPCVTVPRDERWGRTYEGFGEAPELAAPFGEAAVRGFQGADLADPLSIVACAKHFVGDGGTTFGTGLPMQSNPRKRYPLDQGDTRLSEEELRQIHMQGYVGAVEAGVGVVMVSYSSWNGEKCSGSRRLLTEILKGELGFEGFVLSDYGALYQLPGDFKSQIELAVNAGMDMVMVPDRYQEFTTHLRNLVVEGRVPVSRVDDAVTRILRVKFALGLMDEGRSPMADRSLLAKFGSAEHREVARECVRASLVLLKNDADTLPLSKDLGRVHVAGKSADDIGNQCGGWTITWQGASGATTTGGTTILQAVRNAVSTGTEVTYTRDGSGAAGADVGIVVIGEAPYAEFLGDRKKLALDEEDVRAVKKLRKAGIPVVVVLVSGRPVIVDKVLGKCQALVAAWLPGTEGAGVADVLFGDYAPTGKLSMSWPRSTSQIPVNVGDEDYDPLFPYGYGLSY
jgi:beta-glucosidase